MSHSPSLILWYHASTEVVALADTAVTINLKLLQTHPSAKRPEWMVETQMMTVTHLLLLLQWEMAIMKTFILNRVIVQEYHAPSHPQRVVGEPE